MKQYVPLFEEYIQINENQLIDQIFENVLIKIYENDELDELDELKLTSGEKAARTKGFEIGQEWQFAFAYLDIKGSLGAFGNPTGMDAGDYVTPMPLSTYTFVKRKMADLEDGKIPGENDHSNNLDRKVVQFWEKFKNMPIQEVEAIASSGIDMDIVKGGTVSSELRHKSMESRNKKKAAEKQIATAIMILAGDLIKVGVPNPHWKALHKYSTETGIDINTLRDIYRRQYNVNIQKPS